MAEKKFWDKFYAKHHREPFEWLVDFGEAEQIVSSLTQTKDSNSHYYILDCGCGTSLFSYQLLDSYKQSQGSDKFLICADFSGEALELLRTKQNELSKQTSCNSRVDFVQCNCKQLPFRDNLFDLIIDKGYLDSLLKEANASHAYVTKNTLAALANLLSKLERSTGSKRLLQITDEVPELRLDLLDQFNAQQADFSTECSFKEISVECRLGNQEKLFYAYLVSKVRSSSQ